MSLRSFREKANIFLYDSKSQVLNILSALNIIAVIAAMGLLVYYYGFPLSSSEDKIIFQLIQGVFTFYILRYIIRFVYDFEPKRFLKEHWFEGILMGILLIQGVSYNFFNDGLVKAIFARSDISDVEGFTTVFIQLAVFMVLIVSLFRKKRFGTWMKIHPALLFTISIFALTLVGSLLLMLPEMSQDGISFTDALFTAMSSVSVTGLTTVDISSALTLKGQIVVLALIKLGGLNTIAFGALMLVMARFGVGIKHHEVIEDFVNKNSVAKANSMLFKIVIWASVIEVIGIFLLYVGFGDQGVFADPRNRLYQAVFHGVSGFNNAGLSILPGGMMHPDVINNYFVHTVVMILFFFGGLGMIYVFDLFEISRLRERMRKPWKSIEFGTKISLYYTLGLLLMGALIFYIFEYDHVLEGKSGFGGLVTALFESMTTRNAGFNVVDTGALSTPVLISFLFLMFIGASSGSAGGGIRTSTFAIIWASVIGTIRGKKNTELFKRTIPNSDVLKAYAIFMFFVIGNVVGPFVLAISEADLLESGRYDFMDLVFEHVSAASTVGLSTGLTSELSEVGKFVLIIAMFIGRVGTLTLAYLLGKQVISKRYKYPEGHTMIG
jgi:Trk-type K+ transport system membrane component